MTTLEAHTHPLIEGYAPKADVLNITAMEAGVKQYGRYVAFTDKVSFDVKDPVISETIDELGEVAAETFDLLAQEALFLEAQPFYAHGTSLTALLAATAEEAKPKLIDFLEIALYFEKLKVKPIRNGKYVALCSPAVYTDMILDENVKFLMSAGQNDKP